MSDPFEYPRDDGETEMVLPSERGLDAAWNFIREMRDGSGREHPWTDDPQ